MDGAATMMIDNEKNNRIRPKTCMYRIIQSMDGAATMMIDNETNNRIRPKTF